MPPINSDKANARSAYRILRHVKGLRQQMQPDDVCMITYSSSTSSTSSATYKSYSEMQQDLQAGYQTSHQNIPLYIILTLCFLLGGVAFMISVLRERRRALDEAFEEE